LRNALHKSWSLCDGLSFLKAPRDERYPRVKPTWLDYPSPERKKGGKKELRLTTKQIALATVFAALKLALNMVFHGISFGAFNFRISNALLGTLPFTGWAGVLAFFISGLWTNSTSPLGLIDMISPFIGLVFSSIIVLAGKTQNDKLIFGAMVLYGTGIGLWVGYMLNAVYGLPLILMMVNVVISNTVVSALAAFPVYKAMNKVMDTHFKAHYQDLRNY